MTQVVERSFMYPCPRNWVAVGRAVVYYSIAAQAFSAGIKYRHYTYSLAKVIITRHTCPRFPP